jgi:hypothetical protein
MVLAAFSLEEFSLEAEADLILTFLSTCASAAMARNMHKSGKNSFFISESNL